MQEAHGDDSHPPAGPDAAPDTGIAALEEMTRVLVRLAWSSAHSAPSGVSFSEFRALLALHELGVVPSSRLAAALEVNASSITRLADKLAERGYLTRGQLFGNRGVVTLELTEAGRDVVGEVLRRRHAALGAVLGELPRGWRERIVGDARRFSVAARAANVGQFDGSWPL